MKVQFVQKWYMIHRLFVNFKLSNKNWTQFKLFKKNRCRPVLLNWFFGQKGKTRHDRKRWKLKTKLMFHNSLRFGLTKMDFLIFYMFFHWGRFLNATGRIQGPYKILIWVIFNIFFFFFDGNRFLYDAEKYLDCF